MPTLLGIDVSPDVYEANRHLETPSHQDKMQPKRKAVTLWRTEREFQAAVFQAAAWEAVTKPEYRLLFHIPNENSHKQPGVRGGIPDIFFALPRGGKGGLFIELKIGDNKPSQKQLSTISDLRLAGYEVAVIWDSVNAVMETIAAYLAQ